MTTKTKFRLHRGNISKAPILTKLEGPGKVNISTMCPGGGFPRRVPLDSYNMRKIAGKRFVISQKRCNSRGTGKVASFVYFHYLCPLLSGQNDLQGSPGLVNESFFVDQVSCLPFCPGKFIYSLNSWNSWLNCANQSTSWLSLDWDG